jgi:hypothetical protein
VSLLAWQTSASAELVVVSARYLSEEAFEIAAEPVRKILVDLEPHSSVLAFDLDNPSEGIGGLCGN